MHLLLVITQLRKLAALTCTQQGKQTVLRAATHSVKAVRVRAGRRTGRDNSSTTTSSAALQHIAAAVASVAAHLVLAEHILELRQGSHTHQAVAFR
jgi:hypothetical protein